MKRLFLLALVLFALLSFTVYAETPAEQAPVTVETPPPPAPVIDEEDCEL
ncbi:MAG: hypothetical protein FWC64_02535 [Treponema sp.]|nr:hypothetical protein [Treponema sp.]